MPRSRNPRAFHSGSLDTSRQNHRKQVIDKANRLLSTQGSSATAVYLAQNLDETLLYEILENFDATPISFDAVTSVTVEAALRSLTDMATVMASIEALLVEEHDPPTAAYLHLVMRMLVERWSEITTWINFFIEYIPQSMDRNAWEKVMAGCIQVLEPIFMGAEGNTYMSQIASSTSTIDIALRLLCLKDPYTKRPSRVSDRRFASSCSICSLFASISSGLFSEIGKEAMSLRLATLNSPKMTELLKCISARIQDALSAPENVSTVEAGALDIAHLASVLSVLPRSQLQRRFAGESILSEATRAVAEMVDRAVQAGVKDTTIWSNIGECISNLIRISKPRSGKADHMIEMVLEAGIIPPLLLALPLCTDPSLPRGLDEAAQDLLYWILDSRLFLAGRKGGWCEGLLHDPRLKASHSPASSNVVKSLRDAYVFALHYCEKTFGAETVVPVRMCCSLGHKCPTLQHEDLACLKVCGRCHSMVYCSEECQREDWQVFHSKECFQAACGSRQLKEAGISVRYRRDKLLLLVRIVNELLPGLPVLRREQQSRGIPYSSPVVGSHILAFDFTGVMLRLVKSLTSYVEDMLPRFFKTRNIERHPQARILQCAREVQRSPDSLLLVAGTFISSRTLTTICVKMQYSANAADGEKYRVINTVFNTILRSSLPPRDEAGAKLWAELGRK